MKRYSMYDMMEGRFGLVTWAAGMWFVIAWAAPLLFLQAIAMAWPLRNGLFASLRHERIFSNLADGLYVFDLVYVLVMMLVTVGLVAYYFYYKYKYHKKYPRMRPSTCNTMGMRIFIVTLIFVYGVIITIGSVMFVACTEVEYMRGHSLAVKYPNYQPPGFGTARTYARRIYSQTFASVGDGSGIIGGHLFDMNSYAAVDREMTEFMFFSNDTVMDWARDNLLYVNGVRTGTAMVGASLRTDALYTYEMVNGQHKFATPTWPTFTRPVNTSFLDYELARDGLTEHEISSNSAAYLLLSEGGSPTDRQVVSLMGKPEFQFALSYTSLLVVADSLRHRDRFDLDPSRLNLECVLNQAKRCSGMTAYAEVVFLITFFIALAVSIWYLIMMVWGYDGYRYGYKKMRGDGSSEGLLEGHHHGDHDNSDEETEWSRITSHSSMPGSQQPNVLEKVVDAVVSQGPRIAQALATSSL